jgi:hypothetical protein
MTEAGSRKRVTPRSAPRVARPRGSASGTEVRAPAGYSGTPLPKKLGITAGSTVLAIDAPPEYTELVRPLPDGASIVSRSRAAPGLVHLFVVERAELARRLTALRRELDAAIPVWVSWPKKAAGVPTDVTEDVIRRVALPLGFVDIKVCAVSDIWSGLKLVVRKSLR